MAATFDAVGTVIIIVGDPTDDTTLTIGAGANRALTVILAGTVGSPPTINVTWDQGGTNQAMTQVATLDQTGGSSQTYSAIFGLRNPASGNLTLRIAGAPAGMQGIAVSWTGVEQSTDVAAFNNNTTNTSSGSTSSVVVNSATGNAVIAIHACAAGSPFTSTNQTQLFAGGVFPNTAGNRAAGAATVSMTGSISGLPAWTALGINISQVNDKPTPKFSFELPRGPVRIPPFDQLGTARLLLQSPPPGKMLVALPQQVLLLPQPMVLGAPLPLLQPPPTPPAGDPFLMGQIWL